MSAFICSHAHINALMDYMYQHRDSFVVPSHVVGRKMERQQFTRIGAEQDLDIFGQYLVDANFASVNYRYGRNDVPYQFSFSVTDKTLSAIEFIKAVRCLDYQSCEIAGYAKSEICMVLDRLIVGAAHHLPGYTDACWHIEDRGES